MIALLDLGLIIIDGDLWGRDQAAARSRGETIVVHAPYFRKYGQFRLLWSDDFYEGFPWNQPSCPPPLQDYCVVVRHLVEELRGQNRLVALEDLPEGPPGFCELTPDLLVDCAPDIVDLRDCWRWLLTAAVFGAPALDDAISVPTWSRASVAGARAVEARHGEALTSLPLLLDAGDWGAFVARHYRPELRERRVTVLGGNRAPFERARVELEAYGLRDCRRVPPIYEEHRTKAQTIERLRGVDLLIVCTNRLKHSDTDHLKSDQITCAISYIEQDSETALIDAVLAHFRGQALGQA